MIAQQIHTATIERTWGQDQLGTALATAHHIASQGGRRLHLSRADREDLRQDILLAMVQRSRQFDPLRGAWSTYVSMLARHVVADRVQAKRRASDPDFVPLDVDDLPSGCSATQQDHVDPTLSLDLQRVADELPAEPQDVLRIVVAMGDVAEAQRASTRSCASFYRAVADLRFWLRATGMRPPSGVPRQRAHAIG